MPQGDAARGSQGERVIRLDRTIPAMPVRDVGAAVAFYRERLGFDVIHQDDGFAVVRRDEAVLHLWEAADESWRERGGIDRPVRSGAESYIAGTASCRICLEGVDPLFEELRDREVLHPVSKDGPDNTDFGTREFATLDLDGNLIAFFAWTSAMTRTTTSSVEEDGSCLEAT